MPRLRRSPPCYRYTQALPSSIPRALPALLLTQALPSSVQRSAPAQLLTQAFYLKPALSASIAYPHASAFDHFEPDASGSITTPSAKRLDHLRVWNHHDFGSTYNFGAADNLDHLRLRRAVEITARTTSLSRLLLRSCRPYRTPAREDRHVFHQPARGIRVRCLRASRTCLRAQ